MINQEELPEYQVLEQEADDFIDTLLYEPSSNKEMFQSQQPALMKQQIDHHPNDFEDCHSQLFALDILQKEQSNYFLPEKPFQDVGEDDQLILSSQQKKIPASPVISHRKDSRIDKIAYVQQSRWMKIQRYRQKKPRRIWGRKIFYDCRKLVADSRERINGRFVKKSPLVLGYDSTHKASLITHDLQILKEFSSQDKHFQNFYL